MTVPHLLIYGCGKMGGAMLKGALAGGWPAASITVVEPFPSPIFSRCRKRRASR